MNLREVKQKLDEIEIHLNMSFEEYVSFVLKEAENDSYNPYESKTKQELQVEYLKTIVEDYYNGKKSLIKEAKRLQSILDEAQSLQHELNMIREAEIIETVQSVINKQIRKNYLDIEKNLGKYPDYVVAVYIDIFNVDIYNEDIDKILELEDGWK